MGGGHTGDGYMGDGYMGMDVRRVGVLAGRFRRAAAEADALTVEIVAALDLAGLAPGTVVADVALLADELAAVGTELQWRAERLGAHSVVCQPFSPPLPTTRRTMGASASTAHTTPDTERRIAEVMSIRCLDRAAAASAVRQIDFDATMLFGLGLTVDEVATALTIADRFDVTIAEAVAVAAEYDTGPLHALGWLIEAAAFDMTVAELRAFQGLQRHFDVFDDATGGDQDGRVSEADLRFVVDNADCFDVEQVDVARALLDHATLRARLDTATANTAVLDTDSFGSSAFADRTISRDDIHAFLLKATVNHVLWPHRAEIDVAADEGGSVDHFHSRADFERFAADDPDLPGPVLAAARNVVDAGWFDRTFLERHRDDLATAAAVVAGTVAIVGTGGAASLLVVALAAAGTAAAVTVGVNATGDAEDLWDGAGGNTLKGGVIGFSMAGLPASWAALRTATSPTARALGGAELTANASDIVARGGADVLIPARYESGVHRIADATGLAGDASAHLLRSIPGPAAPARARARGPDDTGGVDAVDRLLGSLVKDGDAKASDLVGFAERQGWVRQQSPTGPVKYVDENGVERVTIKKGSARTPGSDEPHVALRSADDVRVDPTGQYTPRRSLGNHTPINWDLD